MDYRVELVYRILLTKDLLNIWFADSAELVGLWATTPAQPDRIKEARYHILELIRDTVE